jgi:hypothetical protein
VNRLLRSGTADAADLLTVKDRAGTSPPGAKALPATTIVR